MLHKNSLYGILGAILAHHFNRTREQSAIKIKKSMKEMQQSYGQNEYCIHRAYVIRLFR